MARVIGRLGPFGPRFEEGKKEIDSVSEGDAFLGDDEVDGVEVLLASEASGEIGLGIGGRVELKAERTEEAKEAFGHFAGEAEEFGDDEVDGDIVSEAEEGLSWDAVSHDGSFPGYGSLSSAEAW